MTDNPEEDIEEQIADNVEATQEANEEYMEDNSPGYEKPESLYSLFREVLIMKDSSKVGNLDGKELGVLDISVRDCQHIAQTARILNEVGFALWMDKQAQIILSTSSSKKGWFTELFVTAKKFASKEKRLGMPGEGIPVQSGQSFWGKAKSAILGK